MAVWVGVGLGLGLSAVGLWFDKKDGDTSGLLWAAVVGLGVMGGGVGVEPVAFNADHQLIGIFQRGAAPAGQEHPSTHAAPAPSAGLMPLEVNTDALADRFDPYRIHRAPEAYHP